MSSARGISSMAQARGRPAVRRSGAPRRHLPPQGAAVPWYVKLFTVVFHLSTVWGFFHLLEMDEEALGVLAMQICAVHFALLLGLWGPRPGQLCWWWVPAQSHEELGCTLLLTIGLVHYVGVGVTSTLTGWSPTRAPCLRSPSADFWP